MNEYEIEIVNLLDKLKKVSDNIDEKHVLIARLGIAQYNFANKTGRKEDYYIAKQTLDQITPYLNSISHSGYAALAYYSLGMIECQFNYWNSSSDNNNEIRFLELAAEKFDIGIYPDWATQTHMFLSHALRLKAIYNHDVNFMKEAKVVMEKASFIAKFADKFENYQKDIDKYLSELDYFSLEYEKEKPTCFISYSWDSQNHKKWVLDFANDLERLGITVKLDCKDELEISDLALYMEKSIRQSDIVILVCTPEYKRKADSSKDSVGYEKTIITGEILTGFAERKKFLPIIKEGSPVDSLPSFIGSQLWYDFRENSHYDRNVTVIAKRAFNAKFSLQKDKQKSLTELVNHDRIVYIQDNNQNDTKSYPKHNIFDFRYRKDQLSNNQNLPLKSKINSNFQFVEISVSKDCSWYRDWNLLNSYEFSDSPGYHPDKFPSYLGQFYTCARWFFQQGSTVNRETNIMRMKDPILDVTTINKSDKSELIFSISVCPLAVWAIPKQIPQPRIIHISDRYYLRCKFDKLISLYGFENPLELSANSYWRFELCIVKLKEELDKYGGNECLISLVINFGQTSVAISEPIYLGVVG